ncbi:AMP binding protein [Dentipellis sp. KUC8613]|nr:AMP binding protein [Dentipellis sp. KUC8613]
MPTYTSLLPPLPEPATSIWTYLFSRTHPYSSYSQYPEHYPAFIDAPTGRTLSRGALRSSTLRLAHGLRHPPRHALAPLARGDVALVFAPNTLAYPLVLFGLLAAGAAASPANPVYTPAELAHQYRDCGARLVFAVPDALPTVFAMLELVGVGEAEARRRVVVMQYDGSGRRGTAEGVDRDLVWLEELLAQGEERVEEKFDGGAAHATAYLCYSSGTTGKPKGVMTTHKNIVIETQILRATFPLLASGPGKDVLVGVLPLFHIYGLALLLHLAFVSGAPTLVMPRFDPEQFCANIARYRVTIGIIVPPIFLALVNHPATMRHDLSSLRYICSAAAPLSRDLALATAQKLASVGAHVVVGQGYGLTETSPGTHMLPFEWAMRKIGSCGVLVPNVEAKLVLSEDDATGEAKAEAAEWDPQEEERGGAGVKMSARGELWVRGPIVMKGYLNNPAATRASVTPSGWFKTGDIFVRDADGFWYVVDRKKELIKYKGFQVAPAELEALLLTHPSLVDAAVIGINDPVQATELPRAYVVPRGTPAPALDAEIQAWVAQRVAPHKRLRGGVVMVPEIPKSAAGKILRRELRERAKREGVRPAGTGSPGASSQGQVALAMAKL